VQIGRGPATVIGEIAVSQATLPSSDGRVFFARENTARVGPSLAIGAFLLANLAELSSGEIRV
jgi:hypothetical protein